MSWSDTYIGLPYADRGRSREGLDCWGLVRLVYADLYAIDLPDYSEAYVSAIEGAEIAEIIAAEEGMPSWQPIDKPARADLLVFRQGRYRCHVGLFVASGLMLHVADGHCSRIEPYTAGQWLPRLTGIYRHVLKPKEGTRWTKP